VGARKKVGGSERGWAMWRSLVGGKQPISRDTFVRDTDSNLVRFICYNVCHPLTAPYLQIRSSLPSLLITFLIPISLSISWRCSAFIRTNGCPSHSAQRYLHFTAYSLILSRIPVKSDDTSPCSAAGMQSYSLTLHSSCSLAEKLTFRALLYTKSWSEFDRLVVIVPPGESIGF
jgi:hypothetical protein